ncbi:MAG: FG-GAP-like repeat-containing protein, partial [Candidatus Halalkalibacterium sp. M3_1C_030]
RIFESGADPQDRLLVNNGQGVFSDVTSSQLPQKTTNTFDTDFLDIDGDGDLDIITGNFNGGVQVFLNNGAGTFTDDTENWMPEDFNPRVVDFEIADYNGDQLPDIYIAVFDGPDALLLRKDLEQ